MFEAIIFFSLNLLLVIGNVASGFNGDLYRNKRYLVNPNAGPSRAQFIFGLGVPVILKEQALTIGSVIKMQYLVPVNSTEYTSRIFGLANTVSRYLSDGGATDNEGQTVNEGETKGFETTTNGHTDQTTLSDDDIDHATTDNVYEEEDVTSNTLVDLTFDKRRRRSLLYSEGGEVNNNLGLNEELPLDEAIRKQELIDQKYREQNDEGTDRLNRWDFYKILERTAERYGYSGRPCLLRTICEAAEVPFTYKNGLFGEIGHILFTPSTSDDDLNHHTDNEYHAAERLGRDQGMDCETLFPECETSILNTFTQIGLDTLHKFGFY